MESDSGKDAPQLFASFLSDVNSISIVPPTRNVSKKSKWQRVGETAPLMVTLFTYAAAPRGIVLLTERASKPLVVIVVLMLRYELWMVYCGMKGERTRNWVLPPQLD